MKTEDLMRILKRSKRVLILYSIIEDYNESFVGCGDGVIIKHSKMKKFGFEVEELVITIVKEQKVSNALKWNCMRDLSFFSLKYM